MPSLENNNDTPPKNETPLAKTGNASNPSPAPDDLDRMGDNQFLSAGAEKYLRESGNIEDVPDPQEQQDMDKTMEAEK